jgi:nucleobase:cation symporter-1, NCS1 family
VAASAQRVQQPLDEGAASWSIEPVPPERRRLSGFDVAVLWGDLSIGLLVLLTGTFLVPALGLPAASAAILVGTVLGCAALALVGLAGQRDGLPGMVLFRPVLGRRGSYVPTLLNVVQLVGWTGFEFWVMSLVANQVSRRLFGLDAPWLWLIVAAIACTLLALGGPVLVIRAWLERFGVWVLLAVGGWITLRVVTAGDLGALWSRPGTGGLGFWLAVDLVIAQPVSWLPRVADYNRFARTGRGSVAGTFAGYAVGNAWFYLLGALLVLSAGLTDLTPGGIGDALATLAGGTVVLLALLVGETDEAFADIYSSAVSSGNLSPRARHRWTVLVVAAAGLGLALLLQARPELAFDRYEQFLFLIGSVFVPLFGVFLADRLVLRRAERPALDGFRAGAIVAWLAGFVVYQWCVPTGPARWVDAVHTVLGSWLGLPVPLFDSIAGASIPAFGVAFALQAAFGAVRTRRFRSSATAR